MHSMSAFSILSLLSFAAISWTSFAADCQSQGTPSACASISGCEWFQSKCICATNVKIDFIFAVDVSGSIGWSGFQQAKMFLSDVVQQGLTKNARVGWAFFSTKVNRTNIHLTNYTVDELVNYVAGIYYQSGWTNTSGVLQAILDEYALNGQDDRQKVVIMPTDGNPCAPRSEGGCPYDVCPYGSPIKAANIRILVLGVGSDLTPEYLTCLLQDPITDYIPVKGYNYDDFEDILPQLQEVTCPVNFDMKITEIKAQPDTFREYGSRFVEIYNEGSDVSGGDLLFDGLVEGTLPSDLTVQQSQYLVLYQAGDIFRNVTCVDCACNPDWEGDKLTAAMFKCEDSIYFPCSDTSPYCRFNNMSNTEWWLQINDTSNSDEGTNTQIDAISYGQGTASWPTIIDGYTYKLKQLAIDNAIGSNWEQSCYTFGTPGDPPITCSFNNCTSETCQQNGDSDAIWNPNANNGDGRCVCSTGYFSTGCTCKSIPNPSNCIAARIKNSSNTWYTQYYWDRAEWEGDNIQYELSYWNEAGGTTIVTSYAATKRVLEYDWDNRGVSEMAGRLRTIMNGDEYGVYAECWPITMAPTTEPTASPTFSPTDAPTDQPTPSPTHVLPWLFIGGDICASPRCDCAGIGKVTDALCCMSGEDDCDRYSRKYGATDLSAGVADNGEGTNPKYLTIQSFDPYGNFYAPPFDTKIHYQFEYIGLSNFTNLTTNTTSFSSRRRLSESPNQSDYPMMITPLTGAVSFDGDGIDSSESITFYIKSTPAKEVVNGGDAIFRLSLLNCSSEYAANPSSECQIVFPYQYYLYIQQIQPGQGLSWYQRALKPYLWWLVAAMAVFLLLVALLVYRFWNKSRLKGKAIGQKNQELEQLIEEDEMGMAPDLNKNEIGYNPLALGKGRKKIETDMVDMSRNKEIPQHERANVMVEKFDDRVEYGPKYGSMLNDNQNDQDQPRPEYTPPEYK